MDDISIHALVQRAAYPSINHQLTPNISIHALVQRAASVRFYCCEGINISIHALVQRAARARWIFNRAVLFQSTPSCRGRLKDQYQTASITKFQSTPSCRGRPVWITEPYPAPHFNPRPRAEGGLDAGHYDGAASISIHALVQRAAFVKFSKTLVTLFQSTPSCRGRHV